MEIFVALIPFIPLAALWICALNAMGVVLASVVLFIQMTTSNHQ